MMGSWRRSGAPRAAATGEAVVATDFGPLALMLYPGPEASTLPDLACAADSECGPCTDSAGWAASSGAAYCEATVGLVDCEGAGSGALPGAGATGGGAASGTEVSGAGGGGDGASDGLVEGPTAACFPAADIPPAGPATI